MTEQATFHTVYQQRPEKVYWHTTFFHPDQSQIRSPAVRLCDFLEQLEPWQTEMAKIIPKSGFAWKKKKNGEDHYHATEEWILFYPHTISTDEMWSGLHEKDSLRRHEPKNRSYTPEEATRALATANEALASFKKKRQAEEVDDSSTSS